VHAKRVINNITVKSQEKKCMADSTTTTTTKPLIPNVWLIKQSKSNLVSP
jgi:hypothetical protein